MSRKFVFHTLAAAAALSAALVSAPAFAQQKFITIGTGGVTGVYYAAGGAICRLVNKDRAKHGIRCSVESTGGSVFNVNTIKAGELDLGFTQSDVQYNATKGLGQFKDAGACGDLRAVLLGAPRAVHGAGAQGGQRQDLHRLQGQALQRRQSRLRHARFDGGAAGRAGLEAVATSRWPPSSRPTSTARRCATARSTASTMAWATPRANIQDPTTSCGAKLVSITGPAVDKLIAEKPYYAKAIDPGRPVPQQPASRPTPTACWRRVVASAKTPPETVVPGGQGGVRQLRRVQEAASRAREPEGREHGQERPVRAAA